MSFRQLGTACSRSLQGSSLKAVIRHNYSAPESSRLILSPNRHLRSGISDLPTASLRNTRRDPLSRSLFTSSKASSPLTIASAPPAPSKSTKKLLYPAAFLALLASATTYYLFSTREAAPQLSVQHFTPLTLLSKVALTADTTLYKLALPKELLPKEGEELVSSDPIRSVYIMQPELQIQRAYTPLSAKSFDKDGSGILELVIKKYPDGEVSRWMHRLNVGDEIKVRGPAVTWFQREVYDEVIFIVGGTGITPAYQYLQHLLSSSQANNATKISVIYSSPTPSSILLKPELDKMSSNKQKVKLMQYLVDKPDEGKKVGGGVHLGRLARKELEQWIGRGPAGDKKRMVLVSGPEGMVEHIAGPRGRNQSSGPVGGLLAQLGYTESQVVKL